MGAVMRLLNVLLRSADVADACREGSRLAPRAPVPENPHRHVPPVAPVDAESVGAVLAARPLMHVVQESFDGMPFLLDLLAFLSWENEDASRRVLALFLNSLADAEDVLYERALRGLFTLINVGDSHRRLRVELALFGGWHQSFGDQGGVDAMGVLQMLTAGPAVTNVFQKGLILDALVRATAEDGDANPAVYDSLRTPQCAAIWQHVARLHAERAGAPGAQEAGLTDSEGEEDLEEEDLEEEDLEEEDLEEEEDDDDSAMRALRR